MSTLEMYDENGGDDNDDSPTLGIETSAVRTGYPRRPWWKSSVAMVLLVAIIMAIIFAVSYSRPNSQSSPSNSELSAPQQGSGTDGSTTASPGQTSGAGSSSGSPTPAPTMCAEEHFEVCQTDRMGHETPLFAGQALCNHQFRFGITPRGSFEWYDCAQQVTRVIYKNRTISYFSMSSAGVFRVMDLNNQTIWQKKPKMNISYTKQCLSRPLLDCPYLHLHRDGVLVLNSIENGQWSDRNVERAFDGLFQS